MFPVRRDGRAHVLGERSSCEVHSAAEPMALRSAAAAIHEPDYLLERVGEFVVGGVISVALFSIVGTILLFLDNELFQRRLCRCCSPGMWRSLGLEKVLQAY